MISVNRTAVILLIVAVIVLVLLVCFVEFNIIPKTLSSRSYTPESLVRNYASDDKMLFNFERIANQIPEGYDIPFLLHQTYFDKTKIPQKVFDNIQEFAPNYTHAIFDDEDCIRFLTKYFDSIVVKTFKLLKGAHRADLFRYCILYVYGGVYLDIKTQLTRPLSEVFVKSSDPTKPLVYTVMAYTMDFIYNGIIATPPKNKLFLRLIHNIVQVGPPVLYHEFLATFFREIAADTNTKPGAGYLAGRENNYQLFQEICTRDPADCCDGLDRYKLCCHVYSKDSQKEAIIKIRYADFPW